MRLKKTNNKYPQVHVYHDHNIWDREGNQTTVYLMPAKGVGYAGQALCSEKDQYCKRKGRSIAYGRALRGIWLLTKDPIDIATAHKYASQYMGKMDWTAFLHAFKGEPVK